MFEIIVLVYRLTPYFDNLKITLKDVPVCNIFNYDETAIVDSPGKKKMLYQRGVKYPTSVENFSKSSTTLYCAAVRQMG